MALLLLNNLILAFLLFFCIMAPKVSSHNRAYAAPSVARLTDLFGHVSVDQGFSTFFGGSNVKRINNGSMATLALDKSSGSGLVSRNKYYHGFFSAAIKLPSGLSSGVVLAFGREEKFYFWFDPTAQHHYYSIIWNSHHIVFLVDNVPLREFPNTGAFSSVYPSKPMSVYVTIWDGSQWATHGGKYPVNYKYAPFVASLAEMEMAGCVLSNSASAPASCSKGSASSLDPVDGQQFTTLSKQQVAALDWSRRKLMFYSYCKDTTRFKVMPPECK